MSARVEAAAKVIAERENAGWPVLTSDRDTAVQALAAADAVMFSDEAVERAARAIHALGTGTKWEDRHEDIKALYREDARTVIAALKEEA